MPNEYQVTKLQIPLTVDENKISTYNINTETTFIIIDSTRFLFGKIGNLTQKKTVFSVPYQDHQPHLNTLAETISHWQNIQGNKASKIAVLIPQDYIPVEIIVQTLHYLKKTNVFEHIVLGDGLV